MENNKEKAVFEIILFFYQLESMIKNHNILLKDKIVDGDMVSASLVFNNALILTGIQKIIKENPVMEEFYRSPEFKNRLSTLLSTSQESVSEDEKKPLVN